jgi:Zn ribbon nucleic-acid-binding protein
MSAWRGEADCPRCGGEGTLLVSGETANIEIDGCWVCGYGREEETDSVEFVPLHRLKVLEQQQKRARER